MAKKNKKEELLNEEIIEQSEEQGTESVKTNKKQAEVEVQHTDRKDD